MTTGEIIEIVQDYDMSWYFTRSSDGIRVGPFGTHDSALAYATAANGGGVVIAGGAGGCTGGTVKVIGIR